ncbi:CDK-activating kinase assembly factor MAT1-domain-containing protein [Catenaria anguillulae PL171]|uniref:RNA polymerase II transcription factor B subunit 3 n=1 Tax=Catenaria anguillulae PL171 TaxID=765915 RepID=A0A1Y2HNS9_9FUNG|nr:CDK-activating kinase assembly factor MAT1-domain-containing protein [Catenaria anguillulae PL171]
MDRSADQDVTCHSCHFNRTIAQDRKVLVTLCFHKICQLCLGRILRSGKGVCPKCGREIRQSDVQAQKFEDLFVDREVRVRKRMLRVFNKIAADFPNQRAFDDYLEMVEEVIFNLANDIDVDETNALVEKYRRENQETIERNRARVNPETRVLAEMVKAERERAERRRLEVKGEIQAEQVASEERKAAILNELASSNLNANDILRHHSQVAKEMAMRAQYALGSVNGSGAVGGASGGGAGGPNALGNRKGHTFEALADRPMQADGMAMGAVDPFDTLYVDIEKDSVLPADMMDPSRYHDSYTPSGLYTDRAVVASGYSVTKVCWIRALDSAYKGLLVSPKRCDGEASLSEAADGRMTL